MGQVKDSSLHQSGSASAAKKPTQIWSDMGTQELILFTVCNSSPVSYDKMSQRKWKTVHHLKVVRTLKIKRKHSVKKLAKFFKLFLCRKSTAVLAFENESEVSDRLKQVKGVIL